MIGLHPGATLSIKSSTIDVLVEKGQPQHLWRTGTPQGWLIHMVDGSKDRVTTLHFSKNIFTAYRAETLGLIALGGGEDVATITRRRDYDRIINGPGYTMGDFVNNTVRGFTGVFVGAYLKNFRMQSNRLENNFGQNFMVSGSHLALEKNTILSPGNGGNGDGISLIGYLDNSTIIGNTIVGGSCYGIWFQISRGSNLLVSKNHISYGITGGIHFSQPTWLKPDTLDSVDVANNHLYNNRGFGISIDDALRGITLRENVFYNNHPNRDEEIGISKRAQVVTTNNRIKGSISVRSNPKARDAAPILYF